MAKSSRSRSTVERATIFRQRLARLRRAMRVRRTPAIFAGLGEHASWSVTRRYLTGFTGTTGAVFVTPDVAKLYVDFRYTERARQEVPSSWAVTEVTDGGIGDVKKVLRQEKIKTLALEDRQLSQANYARLGKIFSTHKIAHVGDLVEELRLVKDEFELNDLRQAIRATDDVFVLVVRWLKSRKRAERLPTEEEVAWKVREIIHAKRLGELAFTTIVASGDHAARPHHEPTRKRLKHGDEVTIDMGVAVNGYHADMTRTVYLGTPSPKQRAMYQTVFRAQRLAISYLRDGGRSAAQADKVARDCINKKFPGTFGHSLGHGVGLQIHEAPTLATGSPHRLKNNMVFSVEPGVYLPGVGGVRIEDLVLLKTGDLEVLSRAPKTLRSMVL